MKVTRFLCYALCLVAVLSLLCSCKVKEKLTVKQISAELEEICLADEEIYTVSKSDIENRFNFDGNLLDDCVIKMSKDEEELVLVAVMQIKEKKNRQEVIDGINSTVKAASESFSVLGDTKLSQIQQRLFYEYEDILIVVIAEKYEASTKYLEKIKAKKVI